MKHLSQNIMLSKRANVFYLEHAKVVVSDGNVVYLTEDYDNVEREFNIPERNTAFLILGTGTSITNAAARMLSESNVLVGFSGSGGSPLVCATEFVFMNTQSEYRPTEYMQHWAGMWFDEGRRLNAGKEFLRKRMMICAARWQENPSIKIKISEPYLKTMFCKIDAAGSTPELLGVEGEWAKKVYSSLAANFSVTKFVRESNKKANVTPIDTINGLIDLANYIVYGYAAVSLHTLGISYAFPVLHGKTRRGALVFDLADIIKDAYTLPLCFGLGSMLLTKDFRKKIIKELQDNNTLDIMMELIKEIVKSS